MLTSGPSITIAPTLERQARQEFQRYACRFADALAREPERVDKAVAAFRSTLNELNSCPSKATLKCLLSLHVLADLVAQGWTMQVTEPTVTLTYDAPDDNVTDAKAAVRRRHLIERDSQLSEPAVTAFIKGMEQRRLTTTGWHSIYSLMRDGGDLAARLQLTTAITDNKQRLEALANIITPYLQFVEPDVRCEHTGLLLTDIWRYFRHTWTTAYRSVPGRSMMILIRDAAAPHHPVIGIAALGSAVVQQRVRDQWIGWDSETGVAALLQGASASTAAWLQKELTERIQTTYVKDLVETGILTRKELARPTESTIARLRAEAEEAIRQHRQQPQKALHKSHTKTGGLSNAAWEQRARTHLFRAKRCRLLAALLGIRQVFTAHLGDTRKDALAAAFVARPFRNSVAQLLRIIKAERVGICMMDITVCGAIAPYNALLGGKLVSALLCSPEVTQHYARRYGQQQSLIASSMRGKGIIRHPDLVFLGTTSLYGVGASQYNRIKIPVTDLGGHHDGVLEYKALGFSIGYGSFHFSNETVAIIDTLLARTNGGHPRRS
ncbi:MAG: Druantia anti-phage system protein DruA [Candidatus Solibacter sp.]